MRRLLGRLWRNERGVTVIEFALLSPVIIGTIIGVVQVSLSVQAYNAMRSVSSDTARYAVVQMQKESTTLTNAGLEAWAKNRAASATYNLKAGFDADVADVATPQVTGVTEKTLTLTYTPPAAIEMLGWSAPAMTFTRPIFLLKTT